MSMLQDETAQWPMRTIKSQQIEYKAQIYHNQYFTEKQMTSISTILIDKLQLAESKAFTFPMKKARKKTFVFSVFDCEFCTVEVLPE